EDLFADEVDEAAVVEEAPSSRKEKKPQEAEDFFEDAADLLLDEPSGKSKKGKSDKVDLDPFETLLEEEVAAAEAAVEDSVEETPSTPPRKKKPAVVEEDAEEEAGDALLADEADVEGAVDEALLEEAAEEA